MFFCFALLKQTKKKNSGSLVVILLNNRLRKEIRESNEVCIVLDGLFAVQSWNSKPTSSSNSYLCQFYELHIYTAKIITAVVAW